MHKMFSLHEVGFLVGKRGIQRSRSPVGARHEDQAVAVGRALCHDAGADVAARAAYFPLKKLSSSRYVSSGACSEG